MKMVRLDLHMHRAKMAERERERGTHKCEQYVNAMGNVIARAHTRNNDENGRHKAPTERQCAREYEQWAVRQSWTQNGIRKRFSAVCIATTGWRAGWLAGWQAFTVHTLWLSSVCLLLLLAEPHLMCAMCTHQVNAAAPDVRAHI